MHDLAWTIQTAYLVVSVIVVVWVALDLGGIWRPRRQWRARYGTEPLFPLIPRLLLGLLLAALLIGLGFVVRSYAPL